jgi:site-specific recombinase XerD
MPYGSTCTLLVAAAGYGAMTNPAEGWRGEQEHAGLLPTTIRRRIDDLRTFERFIYPTPLLEASRDDVLAWLGSRPLSAKTRYNLLSTLGCFYRWAILDGLTEVDPTARIRRPKLRRYLPRPTANSDLEVALATAHPRMRAWLLLGAMSGLRCMEIANLDRQDVHDEADPPVMVVRGKGGKERVVPLHPLVAMALEDAGSHKPGPLFGVAADQRPPTRARHRIDRTSAPPQVRHRGVPTVP